MSYLNLAERIRLRFDRKKVGSPTLNSQPGAHTGATRQYIPGYSDSNIVFLNTSTGNDGNTGASIAQAKLTYAAAATAAGSTKKIRVVNNGAALAVDITKPTEMTRGVSGTISGSLTTPVNTFTQAGTPSFGADGVGDISWSRSLSKWVAVAANGKIAYSPDGNVWTQATTPSFGSSTIRGVAWSDSLSLYVAVAASSKIATSSDGNTWTQASGATGGNLYSVCWSAELAIFVAVGAIGAVIYSSDGVSWNTAINSVFSGIIIQSVCWSPELTLFVAVGESGLIGYSSDGINWTTAATPSFGTTTINCVAWSSQISKFIAGADAGKLAYSSDGDVWTQSGTPSFGADGIQSICMAPEISKIVAGGESGKIAYSSDGNVWTQIGTPSFGADTIFAMAYSPLLNKISAGGSAGKLAYSTAYQYTISASTAGFTITAVNYSGTMTLYNCTVVVPGFSNVISLNACRVTESGCHISSNTTSVLSTLFEGDLSITGAPSIANAIDINSNTITGYLRLYNSSATSFERLRDNLIEGGLYAKYSVLVTSGNIRGTRTNTIVTRAVSFSDPVFVDTTDYKLQRVTNGDAQDSPLVNASAYYVNEQGQPRDFGAWSYDDSTLPYAYKQSFFLYKPKDTGIIPEKQPAAAADQGMDGTWDAVNEPMRATEYLTLKYGAGVPLDHITCQDILESLTDLTCEISLDPDRSDPTSTIQVNGAHAVGDCILNIDASTTIKAGMILTIGAYKYYILYCYPSTSPTKLILHQALLSSVADNLVITPQEPTTFGTYQYLPQSRQIPRPQSNETEYVNGATFKFVRQYPQL
jgi:hypothetical protein